VRLGPGCAACAAAAGAAAGQPGGGSRGARVGAGLAVQLARTCLRLRRPASIVAGYAGYLRQQREPQPVGPGQMLHRVIGEITRLETLTEGLRTPADGQRAGRSRDDSDRGVR